MSAYLAALRQRVLIYDGAMGTSIQRYELSAADFGGCEGCNDYLVITRPDVITEILRGYLDAGADALETNTFGANRLKLAEYGLLDHVREVNLAATRIARELCDAFAARDGRPRFVAGSVGPTGMLPSTEDPTLGAITFAELVDLFAEQGHALIEGGCDVLLIETTQDILELKAAVFGLRRAMAELGRALPIQAQVTLDTNGRMLLGTDIAAALAILEGLRVDVIGLNCSTGPEHMREPVRYLCEHSRRPISVIPNAGLPLNVGGRAVYPLEPEPYAEQLAQFVEQFGVNVVGGCCGTNAAHIRALVERVGGRTAKPRQPSVEPMIASPIRAVPLRQDPPPLLVGERVNTQGSRAVKRLILADDYEGVIPIAREQVDGGAHVLDVCVALTERADEAEQMHRLVKKLSASVEAPLMIDTTEVEVVRAALESYPGRAIVNSINLENGRQRCDAVLPLVRDHGAAVIALTIDESGMAKTAAKKLEMARRIYDIACGEYGLAPADLIFDALTFTLATGDPEFAASAIETMEGIRRIKAELPGVLASLGVSNVSFGLGPGARGVLNSVFLHHCVAAGLDMALVNPSHITPYAEIPEEARQLADDLVFNRRPDALARFIDYFGGQGGSQAAERATAAAEDEGPVERRIHMRILHRKKEGIEALLDEALGTRTPKQVLDEILLPAMKEVGDKFGAGELILPFVLQSAEVMKRAVAHLEQYFERKEGYTKGKVVLATVFGDVHDIGKSLVNTILTNNGYTVYDLGKQVPINTIVDKAAEVQADAIGLSALLVSTSRQMPLCVEELDRRGLAFPVLIGGAAINPAFGRRAVSLPGDRLYEPGVFYCKDAFEGLAVMDGLMDPQARPALLERVRQAALAERWRVSPDGPAAPALLVRRSPAVQDAPVPRPPFWGPRILRDVPLEAIWPHLDRKTLFLLHWGGSKAKGAERERIFAAEFAPRLERMQREARAYLETRIAYGYFPAAADGDEVAVFAPADPAREVVRFGFPRQPAGEHLCLADYLRSLPERDVVIFQAVTVGPRATEHADALQRAGDYAEAYFVHGLAVQTAEGLAEYVHARVRKELGLPVDQGRRYSWGYPACPDLAEQEKVFRLLPLAGLGLSLSSGYQLIPEQSTIAIVAHHPLAKYFSARGGAVATETARVGG
ncbi:MAG: methionine synthase [Chloroflexi bacterium]|nr:methionine synthase [Chloroflexota bacterium]